MKKNYTEPEVQILVLESAADILAASEEGQDTLIDVSGLYPTDVIS